MGKIKEQRGNKKLVFLTLGLTPAMVLSRSPCTRGSGFKQSQRSQALKTAPCSVLSPLDLTHVPKRASRYVKITSWWCTLWSFEIGSLKVRSCKVTMKLWICPTYSATSQARLGWHNLSHHSCLKDQLEHLPGWALHVSVTGSSTVALVWSFALGMMVGAAELAGLDCFWYASLCPFMALHYIVQGCQLAWDWIRVFCTMVHVMLSMCPLSIWCTVVFQNEVTKCFRQYSWPWGLPVDLTAQQLSFVFHKALSSLLCSVSCNLSLTIMNQRPGFSLLHVPDLKQRCGLNNTKLFTCTARQNKINVFPHRLPDSSLDSSAVAL